MTSLSDAMKNTTPRSMVREALQRLSMRSAELEQFRSQTVPLIENADGGSPEVRQMVAAVNHADTHARYYDALKDRAPTAAAKEWDLWRAKMEEALGFALMWRDAGGLKLLSGGPEELSVDPDIPEEPAPRGIDDIEAAAPDGDSD